MAAQTMTETHRRNDLVQKHNSQHSVQFSYGTHAPCHHNVVKKILIHPKQERYSSVAVSNEYVHVPNADNFDNDFALKRIRHKDVVHVNRSPADDYEQFAHWFDYYEA